MLISRFFFNSVAITLFSVSGLLPKPRSLYQRPPLLRRPQRLVRRATWMKSQIGSSITSICFDTVS